MAAPWLKPLDALTADDLHALVEASAQESETLEFKGTMYHPTDGGNRELLKDVASMAHQRGGRLMIGVQEDGRGTARAVTGIESPNAVERILNTCYANIDPRVAGLDDRDVPLPDGRAVLVVHIPESLAAPHMITFQQRNLFYRRYGRQNQPMSVREIEAAFYQRFQAGEALHRFIDERKREANLSVDGARSLLLTCTLVHLRDEAIDIHDQETRRLMQFPPQANEWTVACGAPLPSLRGLAARAQSGDYLEVWRSGHVESLSTAPWAWKEDNIPSVVVAHLICSFAGLAEQIYQRAGLESPCVVNCSIFRPRGLQLAASRRLFGKPWDRDLLEVGPMYAETIALLGQVPRRIMDTLYNAFGLDRCNLFDENGQLITS